VNRERRFRLLREMGCICCQIELLGYSAPDMHHLVDKGYRRLSGGDQATIPLCPWHHRGIAPDGFSQSTAVLAYGPSLALHKRRFVAHYGTERELLARVDERLAKLEAA
jgi:hypothetical protein